MTIPERELIVAAASELRAALVQSLPSDDQIILDHVRAAEAILSTVMGQPATCIRYRGHLGPCNGLPREDCPQVGATPRVDASTPSGTWVDCVRCGNPVHPGSVCGVCNLGAPVESDMERDRR